MSQFDPSSLFSAKGLVVVVTGGGSGVGLMISTALENNGATVYIVGRRKDVLEKAAKEHAKHGKMFPIVGDVSSRESLLSITKTIEEQVGYINLLVNNAGIFGPTIPPITPETDIKTLQKRLWDVPTTDFQQTFNVNVTAVFYCTVAFIDLLSKGNKHSIPSVTSQVITISSIAGLRRDGQQTGIAYSTSKAASIHLGKIMANMFKNYQIRSNIIAPGIFPSDMADSLGLINKEFTIDYVPVQRPGASEDMGGLVLYLATRAGAYVSGNVSLTDGGRLGLFPATY
ncbi:hypothetical protein Clacol_002403 [Clathrus columnatus]|uniref:NAD(P)-binding protein n=1 Tax=Clathrus columnatus TaxID=1419009 RepID=A0AAV5A5E8_9AGAM|nr:hypothetical protein Clacol_002403 [Clathrus columnatus]